MLRGQVSIAQRHGRGRVAEEIALEQDLGNVGRLGRRQTGRGEKVAGVRKKVRGGVEHEVVESDSGE